VPHVLLCSSVEGRSLNISLFTFTVLALLVCVCFCTLRALAVELWGCERELAVM